MTDTLNFLHTLRELQTLYHTGELRDWDFETACQALEREVLAFEAAMQKEEATFVASTVYRPQLEV